MPQEMVGRRVDLPDGANLLDVLTQPGDYCGPLMGYFGDAAAVFFLLPIANPADPKWGGAEGDGVHIVWSPPHKFTENPDGTLTIRQSIGAGRPPYYWHGFLNAGRWELEPR